MSDERTEINMSDERSEIKKNDERSEINARGEIERHRHILDFALSSILRRKGRNAALLVVYAGVIFLLASAVFFTDAIRREAAAVLQGSPELLVQRLEAGRHALIPASYADTIRSIRGVSSVTPRLWGYYFDPVAGANYTVVVPASFPHPAGEIVIGSGLARVRRAEPGDLTYIRTYDGKMLRLKVAGILSSDSELVSADMILMGEADFRALFGTPEGMATDLAVLARNPAEHATIAGKISDLLPDARPILRSEILRTYQSVFDWRGGVMLALLAGAVLAFIIFAWDRAAGLSAEERREIGILKAIGWETSDVLLLKFWEGTVISLSAFLVGGALAYVHVFMGSASLFAPVLKGWSVLYPEFRLVPQMNFSEIGTLFFLTVVPYTVATVVPSWRAATVDPDSVMRSQ